jgi:hypothetical protein
LSKPKKKFGYVLDLKRVAGNPKIVVPFKPEASKLWTMIDNDEMPPEEAKAGPLSADQKKVIRDWIAAGAPAPSPGPPSTSPTLAAPDVDPGDTSPPPSFEKHFLAWVGKFHVMVIHFPIALLLAAALGELWCAWRGVQAPWPPVQYCVLLGAAGAMVAVPLGWLLADYGGYGAGSPVVVDLQRWIGTNAGVWSVLRLHRWIGTTVGVWAVGLALLSALDARRERRSPLFRIFLWIGALLVGAAGHFGGLLVHGDDFFNW